MFVAIVWFILFFWFICFVVVQNIKAHENRKQIFSKSTSRENLFQRQTEPVTEPPPWSSSSNVSESLPPSGWVLLFLGSVIFRRYK